MELLVEDCSIIASEKPLKMARYSEETQPFRLERLDKQFQKLASQRDDTILRELGFVELGKKGFKALKKFLNFKARMFPAGYIILQNSTIKFEFEEFNFEERKTYSKSIAFEVCSSRTAKVGFSTDYMMAILKSFDAKDITRFWIWAKDDVPIVFLINDTLVALAPRIDTDS